MPPHLAAPSRAVALTAALVASGCTQMRQATNVLLLPPTIHAATPTPATPAPTPDPARRASLQFTGVPGGQRGDNWCWAAVAQSILARDGINVSQESLAAYFTGEGNDVRANPTTIMRALHPDLEQQLGNRVLMTFSPTRLTSDDLVDSIAAGQPVIVGIAGRHVVVAHAVTYVPAPQPNASAARALPFDIQINGERVENKPAKYLIQSIEVWDPDQKGEEPITTIKTDELSYIDYLMTRPAARQILTQAMQQSTQPPSAAVHTNNEGRASGFRFNKQFGGGVR